MKSEEMLEEVEMNEAMINRADALDNAAYRYFLELLELDGAEHEKVEEIFPWDVSILRELLDYAVSLLGNRNLYICNPCVMEEYGRVYRCTLSECGCKECHFQDRFMEKERVLARITEAMKINGIGLWKVIRVAWTSGKRLPDVSSGFRLLRQNRKDQKNEGRKEL